MFSLHSQTPESPHLTGESRKGLYVRMGIGTRSKESNLAEFVQLLVASVSDPPVPSVAVRPADTQEHGSFSPA